MRWAPQSSPLPIDSTYATMSDVTVTLDTNILNQAVYSRTGASHAILRMVRAGELELALSVPVFEEYRQVLLRDRTLRETGRSRQEMESVLDFLALVGVPTPIHFLWRPNLPDPGDDMFVELAVASGSEYVVTRNSRHYGTGVLDLGARVVTPPAFLRQWRMSHD
jgi:putative PIN family toxin of toxin-antitoxin system